METPDVEGTVAFYKDVLGFAAENYRISVMECGSSVFMIIRVPDPIWSANEVRVVLSVPCGIYRGFELVRFYQYGFNVIF